MAVALTRHFENLRYLLIQYVNYLNNPSATFDTTTLTSNNKTYIHYYNEAADSSNHQKNNWLNIMQLSQATEIGKVYLFYTTSNSNKL